MSLLKEFILASESIQVMTAEGESKRTLTFTWCDTHWRLDDKEVTMDEVETILRNGMASFADTQEAKSGFHYYIFFTATFFQASFQRHQVTEEWSWCSSGESWNLETL